MSGSRREPVLYIAFPGSEEPWYSDFVAALGRGVGHRVYRHDEPPAGQFDGVRVVVDQGGHAGREQIDEGARTGVELWQVVGTGLDHTEVEYTLSSGIMLANTPGQFSATALAEHALLLMLCLAKQIRVSLANAVEGRMYAPMTAELAGRTLALVGFGASARELAKRASALEMTVRAVDAVPAGADDLRALGVSWFAGPDSLHELLAGADYVSIHVPLTPETRNLIDAAALSAMKPGAVLVNVARGAIVDERALLDAVRSGHLAGAGLDVLASEPFDPADPLLREERIIVTPHIAGVSRGTSQRRGQAAAANVARVLAGELPLHLVTSSA
jgi:D-3-phosphoglycerate dehydrogenase